MRAHGRIRLAAGAALAVGGVLVPATVASPADHGGAVDVVGTEYLGEVVVPTGTPFGGTEIGGLSSITYDPAKRVYHALSDDQGNRTTGDPVRYYTVSVDLADGSLDDGDVAFVGVTPLLDDTQQPYPPGGLDPEGFTLARNGSFFLSSEGNTAAVPVIDPFIRRYNRSGRVTAELPIPEHFLVGDESGVRLNLAFESLNPTPDGRTLVTAAEGALLQDGPASTSTDGSLARILEYDLAKRSPVAEYVYEVAPWAEPSAIFGVNGIVEVLPLDDAGTMLVMERSFSVGGVLGGGTGNSVVLNQISTEGATDVLQLDSLVDDSGVPVAFTPVGQHELFAFDDLGIPVDNLEGMTFGPDLPDGRRTLVVVSDNNFAPTQFTQFILLALDVEPVT